MYTAPGPGNSLADCPNQEVQTHLYRSRQPTQVGLSRLNCRCVDDCNRVCRLGKVPWDLLSTSTMQLNPPGNGLIESVCNIN